MQASDITNYTTALRWLYEHIDHERQRMVRYNSKTFSLDRMRRLLDLLGNPQRQVRCVQVGGTKGKGSTCAMLGSMMRACGYTVGSFCSPHMVDLRERITIDGHMIPYAAAADLMREVATVEPDLGEGERLTFFEIMTAVALKYFADEAVDVAVLEVGLGGRLDSTTAADPLVTAITQISLDHTHLLGKDLPSIAREKAGIFKKGVPAITVHQEKPARLVLEEEAQRVEAPLETCGDQIDFSYRFESNRELGPHTRVCLTTPRSRFEHLPVPLRGEHQALNCGLALAILDKLKLHGFEFDEKQVNTGLAATDLPGRMEQVWDQPRIIVDGAHNPASLTALIKALGAHVQYDSLVMIFGCGQDKEVAPMLREVGLGADKVIFTRAQKNPRAAEPADLLSEFGEDSGKMAQTADTLEEAVKLAARAVSREDLILITGSFYLVGEARKYFQDLMAKRRA